MFVIATIGMTHIIIDGSILQGFREWVKSFTERIGWLGLGGIVDCYLCCGTWCGFLMGLIWISYNPFKVFACGVAGGFLANFAAVVLNYLEAQTIVHLDQQTPSESPKKDE